MDLIERLFSLAKLWAEANDRSLSRLATMVVNDGKLFDRLKNGASCTVSTYERFIHFLNDHTNWRDGVSPDARLLLDSLLSNGDHGESDTVAVTRLASGKVADLTGAAS